MRNCPIPFSPGAPIAFRSLVHHHHTVAPCVRPTARTRSPNAQAPHHHVPPSPPPSPQVKSVTMIPEASVMSGPPRTSSPHAVRRSVTMHPHQHPQPHSVPLPHVPDPSDPLHDRVHNIGSRRNTNTSFAGEAPAAPGGRISPLGSRGGAGGQGAKASGGLHGGIPHDVQAQLRHQEEKAAEITKKCVGGGGGWGCEFWGWGGLATSGSGRGLPWKACCATAAALEAFCGVQLLVAH